MKKDYFEVDRAGYKYWLWANKKIIKGFIKSEAEYFNLTPSCFVTKRIGWGRLSDEVKRSFRRGRAEACSGIGKPMVVFFYKEE